MIMKKRTTSARLMLEHWVAREPGCTPERVKELEVQAREAVTHIDSAFELDEAREREAQEKEQKEWEERYPLEGTDALVGSAPFVPQEWSPQRERHDKVLYDTHVVPAGAKTLFFGAKNIGIESRTNMVTSGALPAENTMIVLALGVRLLGKTKEEEDLLLDHLRVELRLGDRSQVTVLGAQASMLRNGFLKGEELQALEKSDLPLWKAEWEDECGDTIKRHDFPIRVGYHFLKPVVIPVRQNFPVYVSTDKGFPEGVDVRVQLFGLETRYIA